MKGSLSIITIFDALTVLTTIGGLSTTRSVQPESREPTRPNSSANPVPSPYEKASYSVRPSDTDGQPAVNGDQPDCPGSGIGCEDELGESALDHPHFLYLPTSPSTEKTSGKLLVFLGGGAGSADAAGLYADFYPVAAAQGYHVIGLTYPGGINCHGDPECFGKYVLEDLTGNDVSDKSDVGDHKQDSIINRLIRVLEWASTNYPDDGWGRYLIGPEDEHTVDWTQVHLAGFSNGSSHVSLWGMLFPQIGRVALLAGPNDGKLEANGTWTPADFIQRLEGVTDTHYFGLVHKWNNSSDESDDILFEVTDNWRKFGMAGSIPRQRDLIPIRMTRSVRR